MYAEYYISRPRLEIVGEGVPQDEAADEAVIFVADTHPFSPEAFMQHLVANPDLVNNGAVDLLSDLQILAVAEHISKASLSGDSGETETALADDTELQDEEKEPKKPASLPERLYTRLEPAVIRIGQSKASDGKPTEDAQRAWALLYEQHKPQIMRYMRRRVHGDETIREDLAEEVFLKALKKLGKYRDKGLSFSAWLYTLAHNHLVDYIRGERMRKAESLDDYTHIPNETAQKPFNHIVDRETLGPALARLAGEQRKAVELRFLGEYTLAETAAMMGKTEEGVKKLQARGLANLRRLLLTQKPEVTESRREAYAVEGITPAEALPSSRWALWQHTVRFMKDHPEKVVALQEQHPRWYEALSVYLQLHDDVEKNLSSLAEKYGITLPAVFYWQQNASRFLDLVYRERTYPRELM